MLPVPYSLLTNILYEISVYYSHVRNEETRTQKSNTLVSSFLLPSNLSSKFLLAEPSQKPSVKTFWEMQHSKFTTPEIRTKPREG